MVCRLFGTKPLLVLLSSWQRSALYLSHKQLEMHGAILSTVATDALVLKHQAISIHTVDQISSALDQIQTFTKTELEKR